MMKLVALLVCGAVAQPTVNIIADRRGGSGFNAKVKFHEDSWQSEMQAQLDRELSRMATIKQMESGSFLAQDYMHKIQSEAKNGDVQAIAKSLSSMIKEEMAKVSALENRIHESSALVAKAKGDLSNAQGISNACNYARTAAQSAYEGVNKVVHGLGLVVSNLCGCAMEGSSTSCALGKVAETCMFPYEAYGQMYGKSALLWETVKSTTNSCKFVGSPAVA